MAVTRYQYTVDSDGTFPNKKVDLPRFELEIKESAITVSLVCTPQIIGGNCCIDFHSELSEGDLTLLEMLVQMHSGEPLPVSAQEVRVVNDLRVYSYTPDGAKRNCITPNWCDKTTWWYSAVRVVDEQAVCDDPNVRTTYSLSNLHIIDTYHGKIIGEDYLKDDDGNPFRVLVSVDDELKTERDPHYGTGGDYYIDYTAGDIVFYAPQPENADVRVTYHYENGSQWIIKPSSGEVLKLKRAECQFSADVEVRDSLVYSPYGYIGVFAPQLAIFIATGIVTFTLGSTSVVGAGTQFSTEIKAGQYIRATIDDKSCFALVTRVNSDISITLDQPYTGTSVTGEMTYVYDVNAEVPASTKIPIADPDIYKTMYDYINDSNGVYPVLPALGGASWRGCSVVTYSFPWDFQTTTDLISSYGMELRVSLAHDMSFGGTFCVGTFYCLRVPE